MKTNLNSIEPFDSFPTSKRNYEIISPMMTQMSDIIIDEVQRQSSGTAFWGAPRSGKSRATRYAIAEVRKKFPTVTCVVAVMVTRRITSDTRFFKGLSDDFNIGTPLKGDGDDMRSALVQQFLIHCTETHDPRVLIILDEAQRLTIKEYSYLIDLTNHMEKQGISPTVILSGQPELLEEREELIKKKRKDVIGRYLENPIAFSGVSNESDLKNILVQFDDATRMQYPADSMQCITAAYAPHLYKSGFRLGNCATPFWSAIEESAASLLAQPIIGMHSLTKAIEMALVELSSSDEIKIASIKSWWKPVLQDSGYLKHLVMVSNPTYSQN